jgi:amino acid adenylation domain-containing protein
MAKETLTGRRFAGEWDLTNAQLGIYFDCLTSDEPGGYIEQPNWYVDGPLDVELFRAAWSKVMAARQNLRLGFQKSFERKKLIQTPSPLATIDVDFRDWSGSKHEENEAASLKSLLLEDRDRPFDLTQAPLWRLHVVRLAAERHWFCWTIHHLISDGWSATLVLADVFRQYGVMAREDSESVEDSPPFTAYVDYLNERRSSEDRTYWTRRLAGYQQRDTRSRKVASGPSTIRFDGIVDPASFASVKAWAAEKRLTLATLAGGAWAASESLRLGSLDVLYGCVTAGRPADLPGVERISGPFMSVLPTRTELNPALEVAEWLKLQQSLQARDRDNAGVLQIESGSFGNEFRPTTLLAFQNYPNADDFSDLIAQSTGGSLKVRDGVFFYSFTHYELDVTLLPVGDTLHFSIHADPHKVDETQVQEIATCFVRALEYLPSATNVADLLAQLQSEDKQETCAGQARLNPLNVLERFRALVLKYEGHEALRDPNGSLTYGDLDSQSSDLAARLLAKGVRAESVVALDIPKSSGIVIAMLAVWKAGAAFLIVNRMDPRARVVKQLREVRASVIVSDVASGWLDSDVPVVDSTSHERVDRAAPSVQLDPSRLAYVTATSGTTGEPRLVMNQHGGLADHIESQLSEIYPDSCAQRLHVVGTAPTTFDAFLDNVLPALAMGHVAVLNDDSEGWAPTTFRELLDRGEPYVIDCTPSQLSALLVVDPNLLDDICLAKLVFGGERPPEYLWAALRASRMSAHSFSIYGATECSVGTSASVPARDRRVTIGVAAGSNKLLILDPQFDEVPMGSAGQIFISGPSVGRGYAFAPGATAESFVPDPWSPTRGDRMYATGDVGVETQDGIQFLGRMDSQVKVRGVRVDLAEVEHAFERQPGVRRASAFLMGHENQVLGCLVETDDKESSSALAEAVGLELPQRLRPSRIGICQRMPLTASGKVDVRAAAELITSAQSESTRDSSNNSSDATSSEIQMCQLWADVLGVDEVKPDDDFYSIGGHSLTAIALSIRISDSIDEAQDMVRDILQLRTPRALTGHMVAAGRAFRSVKQLERVDRSARVDMPAAQRRLWLYDISRRDQFRAAYNTVVKLRLIGRLNAALLRRAIITVIRSHETFRLAYSMHDDQPVVDLIDIADATYTQIFEQGTPDPARPFDLTAPPFVRASLDQDGDGQHVLTMVIHHISVDGMSLSLLYDAIRGTYDDLIEGTADVEPEKIDLLDYTEWQSRLSSEGQVRRSLNYWLDELQGAVPTAVPNSRDPKVGQPGGPTMVRQQLNASDTVCLRSRAVALGATAFDISAAVLACLLTEYTGRSDITLAVPTSGRWHPASERVIGFLTNTVALRIDASERPTLNELVPHVTSQVRRALAHQAVAFDDVISELPPAHALKQGNFGVLVQFNHRSLETEQEWSGGVKVVIEHSVDPVARFPISLNLADLGDEIDITCNFDPQLYSDDFIETFVGRFSQLVSASVSAPDIAISSLLQRQLPGPSA